MAVDRVTVDYPTIEKDSGGRSDQPIPIHYHNGIDSPSVDKQNKKSLNILTDYVSVVSRSNLSLANSTLTVVPFTAEIIDPVDMHDTTVNITRITPAVTGTYRISIYTLFGTSTVGIRYAEVYKRGVSSGIYFYPYVNSSGSCGGSFEIVLSLTTYEYIEVYLYQSSGGALQALYTQVSMQLLAKY